MSNVEFTAIYPLSEQAATAAGLPPGSAAGNPIYPDLPVDALPFDRDVTVALAGTVDVFVPPVGQKFYLVSAMVSTDTAMRIGLVDELDVQGSRPVDGYFAASGGASPNLVPKWYESKNTGNRIRLVTAANGNVKVRVSGFTRQA